MSLPGSPRRNSLTDIHLRLMNMRNAVVRNREQRSQPPAPGKVSRQEIILNMATQLAASLYQTLPSEKQQQTAEGKLRAAAFDLLKAGVEVDAVSEKLQEMFM